MSVLVERTTNKEFIFLQTFSFRQWFPSSWIQNMVGCSLLLLPHTPLKSGWWATKLLSAICFQTKQIQDKLNFRQSKLEVRGRLLACPTQRCTARSSPCSTATREHIRCTLLYLWRRHKFDEWSDHKNQERNIMIGQNTLENIPTFLSLLFPGGLYSPKWAAGKYKNVFLNDHL